MAIIVKIDSREIARLAKNFDDLPSKMQTVVIQRSLNDVGDAVFTLTKRNLVKVTGAKAGRVAKALRKIRASPGNPEFKIVARDPYMTLKDFGPRKTKKGVSAAPWGQRRVFPRTFLGPGGHVFVRTSKNRFPIKKLWGPAIPREMLREGNAEPVRQLIAERLPGRVLFWVERIIARKG